MNFSRERSGSQVCGLSGVQKEGRHRETTAAVVGKWPTRATLPIVPQCGNITSSLMVSKNAQNMYLYSQSTGNPMKIASMSAGLTNRYVEEQCYMCMLRNKPLRSAACPALAGL